MIDRHRENVNRPPGERPRTRRTRTSCQMHRRRCTRSAFAGAVCLDRPTHQRVGFD